MVRSIFTDDADIVETYLLSFIQIEVIKIKSGSIDALVGLTDFC